MKGFFKILAIVLVCGLVFAFISGLDLFETEEDKINAEIAALDFDDSEAATKKFYSNASLGEWEKESDGTWDLVEGDKIVFSGDFTPNETFYLLIPDSYKVFPNAYNDIWVSDCSLYVSDFEEIFMLNKKAGVSSSKLIDDAEENVKIYLHSDIQKNLDDSEVTEAQLAFLLKVTACYGEYQDDGGLYWNDSSLISESALYMQQPVTCARDIDITVASGYEYSIVFLDGLESKKIEYFQSFREAGEVHIPAGTVFAFGIRGTDGSMLTHSDWDEAVTVK